MVGQAEETVRARLRFHTRCAAGPGNHRRCPSPGAEWRSSQIRCGAWRRLPVWPGIPAAARGRLLRFCVRARGSASRCSRATTLSSSAGCAGMDANRSFSRHMARARSGSRQNPSTAQAAQAVNLGQAAGDDELRSQMIRGLRRVGVNRVEIDFVDQHARAHAARQVRRFRAARNREPGRCWDCAGW